MAILVAVVLIAILITRAIFVLLALVIAPVAIAVAPFGEAMHRALAHAFANALVQSVPHHFLQPALLAVVELVIKRLRGVGETLQVIADVGHPLGAAAQPVDR
ncbi:MAG TPA: hypothetical protein VHD34_02880, partial [Xanthobacteraceae bacterium]|nr:hypothetical protein [Xanthobacteraceae bacterium]